MSYRACEPSNLPTPLTNPAIWTVWFKPEPSIKTKINTKYWYDARRIGCVQLMISLNHFIDIGQVEAKLV
jgi:hypothetical protein